jgi:ABC-type uncharacterized transport system ATPase subunit
MKVLMGINILIWGVFVWIGHSVTHNSAADAAAHGIQGVPNHGQLVYYIYVPTGMVVCAVGAYALSTLKQVRYVGIVIEILVLFAFLPFFLGYTGGV